MTTTTTTASQTILLTTTTTASSSEARSSSSSSRDRGNPSYAVKTAKQLSAGALSGLVEVSLTYPTDYVKIMLQLDEGRDGAAKRFRNSADVIRQTVRSHGVIGLYRGFSVVFYGALPKYMFRFGAYEQMKQFYVEPGSGQLTSTGKLLCGLGAGLSEALFAVIPQESVKVKFINDRCSERPKYRGLLHGIREIVREKGLRGTYQGVTPTVLKQSSNQAIRFFVFESLMEWWNGGVKDSSAKSANGGHGHGHGNGNGGQQNKAVVPLFGAIAGAVSVFMNTPLDVVKTRMQGLEAAKYRNTADCILQIARHEGLLAFYKGTVPRLTKVTLEVAIAFSAYQAFLDLFFK